MLSTLAAANALIVRAPRAPAAEAGDPCRVLMLR
jgi:molybdopterin molybdotransferase